MKSRSKELLPVIVIFGPTAVGKTEILLNVLDRRFEVINADSMQVYRFLDIGTAKPSREVTEKIPHHLVDVVDPSTQFTVGDFVKAAEKLAVDIRNRDHFPVVSGGTAFYLKTFTCGLPHTPVGDKKIRKVLKERLDREGLDSLYRELQRIDPVTSGRVKSRDRYRIMRALEVYYVTGKPVSLFRRPEKKRDDFDFLFIGLERPREELYDRIDKRVDLMFEQGLKNEVSRLINMGYGEKDPGMRGIGYREFFEYRRGCGSFYTVKEQIKRNTRRYAKRQITFMKRLEDVVWCSAEDTARVSGLIDEFIEIY